MSDIYDEVKTKAVKLDSPTQKRLDTVYDKVKKMAKDFDIDLQNVSHETENTFFSSLT